MQPFEKRMNCDVVIVDDSICFMGAPPVDHVVYGETDFLDGEWFKSEG